MRLDADTMIALKLDVEGGELSVLLTMDWNITVGVWAIEMAQQEEKLTKIIALLKSHGYVKHRIKGHDFFVPITSLPYVKERKDFCSSCVQAGIGRQIERLNHLQG